MVESNVKLKEIRRLKNPLKIKGFKVYDSDGNILTCVETFSEIRFLLEPKFGILNDFEILKYAPKSKTAAKIRLKNGSEDFSDKLLVNNSVGYVLGLYYVILTCSMFWVFKIRSILGIIIGLVLCIIPLFYLRYIFYIKKYDDIDSSKIKVNDSKIKNPKESNIRFNFKIKDSSFDYLKYEDFFIKYEYEFNELKKQFDNKEKNLRDLVKKRFEPPQLTYDKFIGIIDKSHKVFYDTLESSEDIINLANYSNEVEVELEKKTFLLKSIIKDFDDLTVELIINNSKNTVDEYNNLKDDLSDLTKSVKDYD